MHLIIWLLFWVCFFICMSCLFIINALNLLIIFPFVFFIIIAVFFRLNSYKNGMMAFRVGNGYWRLLFISPLLFGHIGEIAKIKVSENPTETISNNLGNRLESYSSKKITSMHENNQTNHLENVNFGLTVLTLPTRLVYNILNYMLTPIKPEDDSDNHCSKAVFNRINDFAESKTINNMKNYKIMKKLTEFQDKNMKKVEGYKKVGKVTLNELEHSGFIQDAIREQSSLIYLLFNKDFTCKRILYVEYMNKNKTL